MTNDFFEENVPDKNHAEITFEAAFARLEAILEKMNSGTITLDESLKCYEEADKLISICNKRLNDAERKIEILVKNRAGEIAMNETGKPKTRDFNGNAS